MEEIQRQVAKARARLNAQQLLAVLPWTLFAGLLIAAIGVAIPKIWVVQADPNVWFWSWTGGSIVVAVIAAAVLTAVYRRGLLEAAIELDKRFGLKERVSTTLALTPEERETEMGQVLVADAVRRVERVAVAEQFPLRVNRPALLPLVPALVVLCLMLVPDAAQNAKANPNAGANAAAKEKERVITAIKKLQDKLPKEAQKKGDEEGLKDADIALKEINKKLKDLADKTPVDRKEALVKLNDLAKDIAEKKSKLPSAGELKKQLDKLGEMQKGPADKVAEAMKEGDLGKAKDELNKLKDQLAKGELGKDDKQKLIEQLEKMKDKIEEKQRERAQQKEDLKKEIEKKKNEGDAAGAGQLQQKLEEMEAKDKAMQEEIEKMAEKFGDCAECMKKGGEAGDKEAAAKMGEIGEQMEKLEKQIAEANDLEEMEGDIADAKDAMKGQGDEGEAGDGEGDGEGQGKGKGKGDKPGNGMGEGQGFGKRPEEKTDKKFFDSRVRSKMKPGEAKKIGDAGGPNIAGKSKAEIQAEIAAGESREAEAIDDQPLSREQKEHAKQYFQRLRGKE